ncbi:MAG: carbon storage regulator [Anaerovoracaceae bacterium]
MLVISRKAGESLVIGDGITVSILSVGSDKVAVGIEAPREVQIVRAELLDVIEANREATSTDAKPESLAQLFKQKNIRPAQGE